MEVFMVTKTATTMKLFTTHNDLSENTREKMIEMLNHQLADTFDLFSQTKQAHWNVKGPNFIQLHELFDELAGQLVGFADMIAERATAMGGVAMGTARMAADNSRLKEFPLKAYNDMDTVKALVERYGELAASTREGIDTATKIGDLDTADLLTEISREIDKGLWFLEAHIQS
jgi:starvation-inducible DNA-binding protein